MYKDCAYAPLDEIFNKAATEWQKGEYYQQLARKAKGNKLKNHWAKATRAYTRCQALALKVYEALVPPPSKPEDLGLKPWGYWKQDQVYKHKRPIHRTFEKGVIR